MIWLTAAFTALVAVLVPVYWRTYGPSNFLWISDVALFLTLAALWLVSPLLMGTAAVAALPFELAWIVEYSTRLLNGRRLFGVTDYMFDPGLNRWVRGLSLFHVALPMVWFWMLAKWGYEARALPFAAILFGAVVLLTAVLTDPAENINLAFLPRKLGWRVPLPAWIALYVGMAPLAVFWPVHAVLSWEFGKLKGQAQARHAPPRARAVLERQRSAVAFGDLPAEHQANPGAARLGGKKRNEEIAGVGKSRPVVFH